MASFPTGSILLLTVAAWSWATCCGSFAPDSTASTLEAAMLSMLSATPSSTAIEFSGFEAGEDAICWAACWAGCWIACGLESSSSSSSSSLKNYISRISSASVWKLLTIVISKDSVEERFKVVVIIIIICLRISYNNIQDDFVKHLPSSSDEAAAWFPPGAWFPVATASSSSSSSVGYIYLSKSY